MTEQEAFACEIAGDHYGVSLEPSGSRMDEVGRLFQRERDVFRAGWEAAKQYYLNRPQIPDVQNQPEITGR